MSSIRGHQQEKIKDLKTCNWEDEPSLAPNQKVQREGEVTRIKELWSWNRNCRTGSWKELCSWVSWVEEQRHFLGRKRENKYLSPSLRSFWSPPMPPIGQMQLGPRGQGGLVDKPPRATQSTERRVDWTAQGASQHRNSNQFSNLLFPVVKSKYS